MRSSSALPRRPSSVSVKSNFTGTVTVRIVSVPVARNPAGVAANDEASPQLLEWLRKMYERPAVKKTFALGRTQMAERVTYLAR